MKVQIGKQMLLIMIASFSLPVQADSDTMLEVMHLKCHTTKNQGDYAGTLEATLKTTRGDSEMNPVVSIKNAELKLRPKSQNSSGQLPAFHGRDFDFQGYATKVIRYDGNGIEYSTVQYVLRNEQNGLMLTTFKTSKKKAWAEIKFKSQGEVVTATFEDCET